MTDPLSLFIIAVSVILAVVFKWYLYKRIKNWMLTDFINNLAGGDSLLKQSLTAESERLRSTGLKGDALHKALEAHASSFTAS